VLALQPTTSEWADMSDVDAANLAYAELAERQGATFVECGQDLDPADSTYFTDGLHQTEAGREQLASCLRGAVQPLLDASA